MSKTGNPAATIQRTGGPGSLSARQVMRFLVFIVCLAAIAWAVAPLRQRLDQKREIASLVNEQEQVRNSNSQLREDIGRLKNDPAYIEKLARRDLGLIKSDEEAFVVIERKPKKVRVQRPGPANPWKKLEGDISRIFGY